MKQNTKKRFFLAIGFLWAFALWTVAVRFIDVGVIGPRETAVGFATINKIVHDFTGVHMSLYIITDWLGLVPLCFAMGFALLGLIQWIKRKRFAQVDFSILTLGGFYAVVMAVYIVFELAVVNYRPVLINGVLEASYPSSTTMLVMCVMPTAILQLNERIKNRILKGCVSYAITAFIAFVVIGRLLSGVHWVTDIMGGALLSAGLVTMYHAVSGLEAR